MTIDRKINVYRLSALLHRWEVGTCYLAHAEMGEPVVVVLFEHLEDLSSANKRQLLYELRSLRQLRHAYIAPFVDAGIDQGTPYIVCAYEKYNLLRTVLERQENGRFSFQETLHYVLQVGLALAHAHERGIVHGWLSPTSVLVNNCNEVQLTGFSLPVLRPIFLQKDMHLAFSYMAPEAFRQEVSSASDQYALACMTYQMLSGKLPFEDCQDREALMHAHCAKEPPSISTICPEVNFHIAEVLQQAMAKKPEERYESIMDFIEALAVMPSEEQEPRNPGTEKYIELQPRRIAPEVSQAIRELAILPIKEPVEPTLSALPFARWISMIALFFV